MRGFLKEIKNVARNRVSQRLQGALGQLSSLGSGLPKNAGGVLSAPQSKLSKNPFDNTHVIYPEDLGSSGQGHYIQFFINEQEHANVGFGSTGTKIMKRQVVEQVPPSSTGPGGTYTREIDVEVPISTDAVAQNQPKPDNSTISVKRSPTKRLASSICMYMPATVGVSQQSEYSESDIGGLAKFLNAFSTEFGKTGSFGDAFDATKGTLKESAEQFAKNRFNDIAGGAKAIAEISSGRVFSNRMEMVFKGVPRRNFSFNFVMMPKSEAEAASVNEICKMFRFYMAPSFEAESDSSRTFIVPATFDIEYKMVGAVENTYLNKISTSVLTGCDITYGGERTTFFRPTSDGQGAPPVQTSITLNFRELEIITRERIGAGY